VNNDVIQRLLLSRQRLYEEFARPPKMKDAE